jgi:hypothetical protein
MHHGYCVNNVPLWVSVIRASRCSCVRRMMTLPRDGGEGRHLVIYRFTFLFVENILFLRFYFLGCNTMWAKDRGSMFLLNVGTNPQVHRTLQTRKSTFRNILLVSKIRGCLQWLHILRCGFWLLEKCKWGLNPMA